MVLLVCNPLTTLHVIIGWPSCLLAQGCERVNAATTQGAAAVVGLASLARIKKEGKLVPGLVYSIEAWEKQLVATGKFANKNLLRDAKRSACRDFRINLSGMVAAAGVGGSSAAGKGGRGQVAVAAAAAVAATVAGQDLGAGTHQTRGGRSHSSKTSPNMLGSSHGLSSKDNATASSCSSLHDEEDHLEPPAEQDEGVSLGK
jgi:hypothetical protein